MDDDDSDIFSNVIKFCNSNSLEEKIDQAGKDIDSSSSTIDSPLQEFEKFTSKTKRLKAVEKRSKISTLAKTRSPKKKEKAQSSIVGPKSTVDNPALRTTRSQTANSNISVVTPCAPQTPKTQRGRARRNYMAELAARSQVVGSIDLITSPFPLPNISSVVSLDSDEEQSKVANLDDSFSTDNPEISVKVKWADAIERFAHRKYQKFSDLMKIFAERENVKASDIVLNIDDRLIQPNDTPDSINYKIYQFISGRVIKNAVCSKRVVSNKKNVNEVEVKVQSDAWKKPVLVSLKKNENFRILYIKCSEELKVPCEMIKLSFDGESLELESTPNDLDFEGGEVIDCRLKR